MTTAEKYRDTSALLYDQAMVELETGDLLQASEKLWGASAQALKFVAQKRGWRHDSHAHFYNIMAKLEDEDEAFDLRVYFNSATQLHINFYENWLDEARIRSAAQDVHRFIERLANIE